VENQQRLARLLAQRLESLERAGVAQLPRVAAPPTQHVAVETQSSAPVPMESEDVARRAKAAATPNRQALLEVIQREVAACQRCPELAATRTQTVFGVGDPQARLCFMGEAPGADEDRQGEPFVGRAGKLLTDIIEKGMGLRREDVFILNVLKCRPPGNRNPNADEVECCRGYFERQLEILQPEFICCLGSIATQALLDTKGALGRMRGRFHDYRGIKVVVTYHPSYLLRCPQEKKKTWEDIRMLMNEMGLPLPK
jgi:DNA polymerase